MPSADVSRARAVIEAGLARRAFPAAAVDVGTSAGPAWREAFGRLTYEATAPACHLDTMFDVASLTKVMVTTPLAMALVGDGRLALDTPVRDLLPSWTADDRKPVTVRHLLDHSSGLPAVHETWRAASGRDDVGRTLAGLELAYAPGTRSLYSDPGFILLGLILESVAGATLQVQYDAWRQPTNEGAAMFVPPATTRTRIAPTGWCDWRQRELQGEVHDRNAAALGGVAAHAGLFATAAAVAAYARMVLRTFRETTTLGAPEMMRLFGSKTGVPGSSRALGWDTALPTSSCGTHMSARAIGHTGFTGTSLWIDPERDLYAVLLTNRVYPGSNMDALTGLRPAFHDELAELKTRN